MQLTLEEVNVSPWAFAAAVRTVGDELGQDGFTVEDVRSFYARAGAVFPANPGALLGGMVANGELTPLSDEPALTPSSKKRRLRRFVLTVQRDTP